MATMITSPYVHSGRAPRKESRREKDSGVPPVPRIAGPKGRMLSLISHMNLDIAAQPVRPHRPKPAGDDAQP